MYSDTNKMMTLDKNSHNTWFFFQVHGLHMKPDENWRNFMFGNATIANGEDIRNYLKTVEILEFNTEEDYTKLNYQFPDTQSFIIVSVPHFFSDKTAQEITKTANRRAGQIAGLIYFYFLFASNLTYVISLANEIHYISGSNYRYYNSEGKQGETELNTKGEYRTCFANPYFEYTINELLKELNKPPYLFITEMIIKKEGKHFDTISNSLVNFYRTSNVPSPITQLLGSVTSIELLLGDDTQKYNYIKNRVKTLLGDEVYFRFIENKEIAREKIKTKELVGVFDKRHEVVHKAESCDENDAFRAMNLYCFTLLGYCKIAAKFSSKVEVCLYLDLVYKYKYDPVLKNYDTLNLKTDFENIKISLDQIDNEARFLIKRFNLCNSSSHMFNEFFLKSVHFLKEVKNLDLKDAFDRICHNIYYNTIPFTNFDDFEREYNRNISSILTPIDENDINIFKENYKSFQR